MNIIHQTVVDSQGKPAAALIPWSEFQMLQRILASDAEDKTEAAAPREAGTERRTGNREAFTNLAVATAELSL